MIRLQNIAQFSIHACTLNYTQTDHPPPQDDVQINWSKYTVKVIGRTVLKAATLVEHILRSVVLVYQRHTDVQ